MCRAGGRRCPAHSDPVKIAERNAVRRATAAQTKGDVLSDAQYKHRVTYAYEAIARYVEADQETHKLYGTETVTGEINWNDERQALHNEIISDFIEKHETVANDGKALFTGGLGGAGKSTVLGKFAGIDLSEYVTVNPDDVKEIMASKDMIPEIPGLSPMESSPLVHEEASHIAKVLARYFLKQRKNLIYDVTMASYSSTQKKIKELEEFGYSVDAVFVDIPSEVSVRRSQKRHREGTDALLKNKEGFGGRMLPLEVMAAQAEAKPLEVFQRLKDEGKFGSWAVWDNSVDGAAPRKIEGN